MFFDDYIDDSQELSVPWPVGLEVLTMEKFDQPIDNVMWPSTLTHLHFGHYWDQSIVGVRLPDSLEELELGLNFTGTLVGALWPSSLKRLSLGCFDSSLDGVVWPDLLEELWMAGCFNQSIHKKISRCRRTLSSASMVSRMGLALFLMIV